MQVYQPDSSGGCFPNYEHQANDNRIAAVNALFDAWTEAGAAPVIEKYNGVLAAADVYTRSTTFWVMESIRLDLGFASYVHP